MRGRAMLLFPFMNDQAVFGDLLVTYVRSEPATFKMDLWNLQQFNDRRNLMPDDGDF